MKKMKRVIATTLACVTMGATTLCMTACDESVNSSFLMMGFGIISGDFSYFEPIFNGGLMYYSRMDQNEKVESYTVGAFGLYKKKSLQIPSTYKGKPVTGISGGGWSFYDMESLELPATICEIEAWHLADCDELTKITVDEDNPYFKSVDGNMYTKDGGTLLRYAVGKKEDTFQVPEGVFKIDEYAFRGCKALKTIQFPDGVEFIGREAFRDCINLEEIKLPDSVTQIDGYAFLNCRALVKVELPSTLTKIPSATFTNCHSLTDIKIPDAVTEIDNSAFSGCSSLDKIELPTGLVSLGMRAFDGCKSLTRIQIPDGVTELLAYTFEGCEHLQEVVLGKNLNKLEKDVFYNCGALEKIYYYGTQETWQNVSVESSDNDLLLDRVYYYSETEPMDKGNYWRYVDGEVVVW